MSTQRNLITYIHGFDPDHDGYLMPELKKLVESVVPNAANKDLTFSWEPRKDTCAYTFKQVAEQLARSMSNVGNYEKHYAVCHSMGGLIARQLMVMGIRFDGIITINSPHEGTALWSSSGSWLLGAGPQSLLPISEDLHALNISDEVDRHRYHFVGVECYGISGAIIGLPQGHKNDTLVELSSQLGESLGQDIKRYTIKVDYQNTHVPQATMSIPCHPHSFVIDHAMDGTFRNIYFDNAPLKEAIRNCIEI